MYFCAVFQDAVRSSSYIEYLFENKQQQYRILKVIPHICNMCVWITGDLHVFSPEAASSYINLPATDFFFKF